MPIARHSRIITDYFIFPRYALAARLSHALIADADIRYFSSGEGSRPPRRKPGLRPYARFHGFRNACRDILSMNSFVIRISLYGIKAV